MMQQANSDTFAKEHQLNHIASAISAHSNSQCTVSLQSRSHFQFIDDYPSSQVFNHLLMQISSEIDHEYEDEEDEDPVLAHDEDSKQQFGDGDIDLDGDSRHSGHIDDISAIFDIEQPLCSGSTSFVHKALHIESGAYYALKCLSKSNPDNQIMFQRERESLSTLNGHPNIVALFDTLEDDNHFYVVTPLLGEMLMDKMSPQKSLSEVSASMYIESILNALVFMHSKDCVHQDVKLEHVMLDEDGTIKLLDFGMSIFVDETTKYTEVCGTVHYIPPEVMRPRFASDLKKHDVWSCGVLCYYLLTGSYPFDGHDYAEILKAIIAEDKVVEYPADLSDSCKQFLGKMLCDDVDQRWTAKEALESEWITEQRYERDVAAARKSFVNLLEITHLSSSTLLALHGMNSITLSTMFSGGEAELGIDVVCEDQTHGQTSDFAMDNLLIPLSPPDCESSRQISWTPSAMSATDMGLTRVLNGIDIDEVLDDVERREKELGASTHMSQASSSSAMDLNQVAMMNSDSKISAYSYGTMISVD